MSGITDEQKMIVDAGRKTHTDIHRNQPDYATRNRQGGSGRITSDAAEERWRPVIAGVG